MATSNNRYLGTRFKKNGGASWSYRFQITLDSGEVYNEERSGFATQKQAFDSKNQRIAQLKLDNHIEKDITFNQLYDLFLKESAEDTRSFNTILRYNSLYNNHIREKLGGLYVNKVQPKKISQFLKEKQEKYKSDYPISFYNFFLVLYKFAVQYKYVKENIMSRVPRPKQYVREEVKLLTNKEFCALRERLETTNVQLAFALGMGLGVRASECYALRWSDFDFDNNTVKITKQLQKRNGVWCFAPLKTKKSARTITFGNDFALYLQSVQSMQKQNRLSQKEFYTKKNKVLDCLGREKQLLEIEDFVNVKQNGQMLSADSNKVISRIAKSMGLDFNYHMLRHYYMTSLAESGVPLQVVRDNVGHTNLRTMLETYLHSSNVEREKAAEIIDTLMNFNQLNDSEK